ncbi:MAG: hypothetical protein VB118_11475 [Oscillospiraceae bacterium]|nr:hypothetical protein [Oscillospiraceae bacterium]
MKINIIRKRVIFILTCVLVLIPVLAVLSIYSTMNFIDPKTGFCIDGNNFPYILNYAVAGLLIVLFAVSFSCSVRFAPKKKTNDAGADTSPASDSSAPSDRTDSKPDADIPQASAADIPISESGTGEINGEYNTEKNVIPEKLTVTKGARMILVTNNSWAVFATALIGFMFISSFLLLITRLLKSPSIDVIMYVVLATAVLSGIYFIISSAKNVYPHGAGYSILALSPALWAASRVIAYFISIHGSVSIPSNFFSLVTPCAIMLFFLNEAKFTLTDRAVYNLRLYLFYGYSAVLLIAVSSLPRLLLSSFWILGFTNEAFFALIEVSVGFYIAIKLYNVYKAFKDVDQEALYE